MINSMGSNNEKGIDFQIQQFETLVVNSRNPEKSIEASYDKFWGFKKGLCDKDCRSQATHCDEYYQGALLEKIRESIDASLRD